MKNNLNRRQTKNAYICCIKEFYSFATSHGFNLMSIDLKDTVKVSTDEIVKWYFMVRYYDVGSNLKNCLMLVKYDNGILSAYFNVIITSGETK
jgi:hypothetical protein